MFVNGSCASWILLSLLTSAGLPELSPKQAGMDAAKLAEIDPVIDQAIANGQIPGAVALIGRDGSVVYAKTYGDRAVEPSREPMTRDSIFDMASLTKPIATATSVMILIEEGKVKLGDPLSQYFPKLKDESLGAVTVEELLRHRSGLIADNAVSDYEDGQEKAWERIFALKPVNPPGEKFLYSDMNFIILGKLVETVSGKPLDQFALERIFKPLGMTSTFFKPDQALTARVVPTEKENDKVLRGVVHDPRSRLLGGVAGHAGLFSTADDVAVYAQTLLNGGKAPNGHRLFKPETVQMMIDPGSTPARQRRGLGWDVDTGFSAPKGSIFGAGSFGHTGFTGTSIWVDPKTRTFVILLSSRLHPQGKANLNPLRSKVATLAASAILDREDKPADQDQDQTESVRCGIDVLEESGFALLQGKRVGLITNHTGRTRDGRSTIDVLFSAQGVELKALFSPEHGIRGQVDATVADSKDEKSGLPIHSLYGAKSRKPSAETLKDLDVLVYDIQDVGVRYYTYISTLGLGIEAAKEAGLTFVVLDRPNPIGGLATAGPIRDPEFESFIAYHALPIRHGMTVGELARLFNAERQIDAKLEIVPCRGWSRGDFYDQTGLLWVNPSPNMRSLTEALIYPGVGYLEATNLATGRGTDTPFERVGAPWIDPQVWAGDLRRLNLPGVRFTPIRFTPSERQYQGQSCGGVYIAVSDWSKFEPVDLGVALAITLRKRYRDQWQPKDLLKLLANREAYDAIVAGKSLEEVRESWSQDLESFRQIRAKYLLDYETAN